MAERHQLWSRGGSLHCRFCKTPFPQQGAEGTAFQSETCKAEWNGVAWVVPPTLLAIGRES